MLSLLKNRSLHIFLALALGITTGLSDYTSLLSTASVISTVFIKLLKLISIPLIFLAIVATITQMENMAEFKRFGKKVFKYTLITTLLAATIGLLLFLWIDPTQTEINLKKVTPIATPEGSYWEYLLSGIPGNFITPFSEGNVIAVLLLALMMSFAILVLPNANRTALSTLFNSLFLAVLEIAKTILLFIPIAIWAFITEFVATLEVASTMQAIGLYLACVIGANLIQGFIVLPAFLRAKQISPWRVFKAMAPAINVAFWSKSSAATLPLTLQCAKDRLGIRPKVAGFSLPLCTAINMNGCAGFIIITVLFVSMSNGITFSFFEMVSWILIATIAAIGNAGVPMGCYFLSLALLTTMNVPLALMFVILPFYVFMDMVETAINVWSDACVTQVVDKEVN